MIDWTKPVETTDGRPVRVLCEISSPSKPYAVKIDSAFHGLPNERGEIKFGAHTYHLRNVRPKPVKREGWVNILIKEHPSIGCGGAVWKTLPGARADAETYAVPVATVRITWEEPAQ